MISKLLSQPKHVGLNNTCLFRCFWKWKNKRA